MNLAEALLDTNTLQRRTLAPDEVIVFHVHTGQRVECVTEDTWQDGEGRTFHNLRAIEGKPFLVDSQLRHHMGSRFKSAVLMVVTANRTRYGWLLEE